MKLDDNQKQQVSAWIEEGLKLSEIQDKLNSDFGLRMTYMEVRFLIDDLGVKLKDKPQEKPPETPAAQQTPATGAPGLPEANPLADSAEAAVPSGKVTVTVDQVTRPGSLVSGKVTFSDGKAADWYLDQMGRLGLASKEQGYKPSQEDLIDFQTELQNELGKLGF